MEGRQSPDLRFGRANVANVLDEMRSAWDADREAEEDQCVFVVVYLFTCLLVVVYRLVYSQARPVQPADGGGA